MEKGEFRFTGPTQELLDRPDILRSVFIAGARRAPTGTNGARAAREARRRRHDSADPRRPPPAERAGDPRVPGGDEALRRHHRRRPTSTSSCSKARSSGSSARTAPARRRCSTASPGSCRVDGGRILFKGEDITELPPHERAELGLGRSFQEARLFPSLTTAETLAVAASATCSSRACIAAAFGQPCRSATRNGDVAEKVEFLIELMGLRRSARSSPASCRPAPAASSSSPACSRRTPTSIVLDEPSGGVAQKETEALGPLLQRVQAYTGTSILVIEHDMPLLASHLRRDVSPSSSAQVIAKGTPSEVLDHPRVIESYLGTDQSAIARSGKRRPGRRWARTKR